MKTIEQSFKIMFCDTYKEMLNKIEYAYRICYASEMKEETQENFIKSKIKLGHESCLEHSSISVEFTVDRAFSHQLVRHRLMSVAQQSQRYVNYSKDKFEKEITFITPQFENNDRKLSFIPEVYKDKDEKLKIHLVPHDITNEELFNLHAIFTEYIYMELISRGEKPQIARQVLPNSTMTKLVVTCNLREWRHILKLRALNTTGKADAAMNKLMKELLEEFINRFPVFFEDLLGN